MSSEPTSARASSPARGPTPWMALLLGMLLAGCAGSPPVWDTPRFGSVRLPETAPPPPDAAGPTLAVRTLEDARPEAHRTALSSWVAEHDGWTGEAVTRDRAYPDPVAELASVSLADRLAHTGRFGRVLHVEGDGRAADRAGRPIDYVLTGRLRRLRGWQAYHVTRETPPELLESLGDAFLDEVEIVEVRTGRVAFLGQSGAQVTHAETLDPYALAHEAWTRTLDALARAVREADLASADLRREVGLAPGARGDLAELLRRLPAGWSGARREGARPEGWAGSPACAELALEDGSRWYFHPLLGRYRGTLTLWHCPAGWSGRMQLGGPDGARFPAEVLGFAPDGGPVLVRSLGATSWPEGAQQVAVFLGLTRPAQPPVLRLPAD